MPCCAQAVWKRTTPAGVIWSVSARAPTPSAAARATSASTELPARRKLKALWQCSSTYDPMIAPAGAWRSAACSVADSVADTVQHPGTCDGVVIDFAQQRWHAAHAVIPAVARAQRTQLTYRPR